MDHEATNFFSVLMQHNSDEQLLKNRKLKLLQWLANSKPTHKNPVKDKKEVHELNPNTSMHC